MIDPLQASLKIAASGLDAQSTRLRIVSENLANAQSTATVPGGDPFRRKIVGFAAELDRASGASTVSVSGVDEDMTIDDDASVVRPVDAGNQSSDGGLAGSRGAE